MLRYAVSLTLIIFADRKQKLVVLRTEEVGFHTEENFLQRMDSQETHDVAVRQSLASDP